MSHHGTRASPHSLILLTSDFVTRSSFKLGLGGEDNYPGHLVQALSLASLCWG